MRSLLRGCSLLALVLVCLAGGVAGCADRTNILIEVTSTDLTIPSDIDSLTIEVRTEFGVMFREDYPVRSTWPHSLAVVPPAMEAVGDVRIDVTGSLGGVPVTRRVATTTWISGGTRRVTVVLTRSCLNVLCGDGLDCVNGRCCLGAACMEPDAGFDAGMFDGGTFDVGIDAPSGLDADIDAPMSMDDGGFDAGRDAGSDAGRDAGITDTGVDAPLPPGARLVINEIDCDQIGTDAAEFVEIFNAGSASVPLAGFTVELVNGSSSASYSSVALSGTLAGGGYIVLGVAGQTLTLPGGVNRFDFPMMSGGGIQNGPDGVRLLDASSAVVDSVAYEATFAGAGEGGPAPDDSNTAMRSICRMPNGSDTNDNSVDFIACATPTPGATN
jgi:hypothetical protein